MSLIECKFSDTCCPSDDRATSSVVTGTPAVRMPSTDNPSLLSNTCGSGSVTLIIGTVVRITPHRSVLGYPDPLAGLATVRVGAAVVAATCDIDSAPSGAGVVSPTGSTAGPTNGTATVKPCANVSTMMPVMT